MRVKYRFLERTDRFKNRIAAGIVYVGFSTPLDGNAVYLSLKSMKEKFLTVTLDDVQASDISKGDPDKFRYELTPIKIIDIPDEDDEWTPHDLLEEKQRELAESPEHRKTA